jgi:hypothetical protein
MCLLFFFFFFLVALPEISSLKRNYFLIPPPQGWISPAERRLTVGSFKPQFIILISLKNQFASFPPPHKSSLGSFALLLMVFFITGWSIQLRLIEHSAGSICEAIYQGEGVDHTRGHQLSLLVLSVALFPAAWGPPEPQVASIMLA